MKFIHTPYLPNGPVGLVVVDGRIGKEIEERLAGLGIKLIKTRRYPGLYDAISYHPDVMLHHLGDEFIVHAPGMHPEVVDAFLSSGFKMIRGQTELGPKYPYNIAYNVLRIGNLAFHNFKFTDSVLKDQLEKRGVELINVRQGYAKCAVSIVNENSIITADSGIAKAASNKGLDVLLIKPQYNILLPGLDCGFIGGSTGLLDADKWAISGSMEKLEAASGIKSFLKDKNMKAISLCDEYILDIGSIIPLQVK